MWLGTRFLKNKYESKTYESPDRFGKQVNFGDEATAAAEYPSKEQWGNNETTLFDTQERRSRKCNRRSHIVDVLLFTVAGISNIVALI